MATKIQTTEETKPATLTPEQIAEQAANQANKDAFRLIMKAVEGGRDYRDEAQALALATRLVSMQLEADRVKPKEQTSSLIRHTVAEIDREAVAALLATTFRLFDAIRTLNGPYQAPMPGMKKPADIAAALCTVLKPASAAAAKSEARDWLLG